MRSSCLRTLPAYALMRSSLVGSAERKPVLQLKPYPLTLESMQKINENSRTPEMGRAIRELQELVLQLSDDLKQTQEALALALYSGKPAEPKPEIQPVPMPAQRPTPPPEWSQAPVKQEKKWRRLPNSDKILLDRDNNTVTVVNLTAEQLEEIRQDELDVPGILDSRYDALATDLISNAPTP